MDLFQIAKLLAPLHHLSPLYSQMKTFQKQKSLLNEAILQHRMRKTSNCFKIIHQQLARLDDTACLLLVATSSSGKDALKQQQVMLMEFIKERPTSIPIHLALIQTQLQSSQPNKALVTLLSLLQARTDQNNAIPIALSALLIWLLQQTGQTERAYEILDGISDGLLTQCIESDVVKQETLRLLKQIASFNLKSQRYQVAVEQYEFLVRLDPTDAQSMAGLITAYMVTDLQKADKYAATLPKVNIDHLDAEALEYLVPGYDQNKTKGSSNITTTKKKKKKRKPLLPKLSLDKMPDPQRWLPLSERTSGNGKLKKQRK
jgi:signal recognition particle subunit SRP72